VNFPFRRDVREIFLFVFRLSACVPGFTFSVSGYFSFRSALTPPCVLFSRRIPSRGLYRIFARGLRDEAGLIDPLETFPLIDSLCRFVSSGARSPAVCLSICDCPCSSREVPVFFCVCFGGGYHFTTVGGGALLFISLNFRRGFLETASFPPALFFVVFGWLGVFLWGSVCFGCTLPLFPLPFQFFSTYNRECACRVSGWLPIVIAFPTCLTLISSGDCGYLSCSFSLEGRLPPFKIPAPSFFFFCCASNLLLSRGHETTMFCSRAVPLLLCYASRGSSWRQGLFSVPPPPSPVCVVLLF